MRHPIQPILKDRHGTLRFKDNAIVRYLLDNGPFDMNHLAVTPFSREDREQFAQLIGYSLSGAGDLSYFSDETWEAADKMVEEGVSEDQARIKILQDKLEEVRKSVKAAATALFRIHPDDFDV